MLKNRCLSYVALLILLVLPCMQLAHAMNNEILVVPARARMIKLAFDIQALRKPTIISYGITDDPLEPLMHVWTPSTRTWNRFQIADIASGFVNIPANPEHVYIISLPEEDLEVISAALTHAKDLQSIQSMSVAKILTALNGSMQFTTAEWQALAKRYDLEVTELNYEKRKWGRFGPPKSQRKKIPSGQPFEPDPAEEIMPEKVQMEEMPEKRPRVIIKPSPSGQTEIDEAPDAPEITPVPEKGTPEQEVILSTEVDIDVDIDEAVEPMEEMPAEVEGTPLPEKGREQPDEVMMAPPSVEEEEFPIK